MPAVSRGVVYSLMAVVVVLLLGIAVLLRVANQRHQRLKDATIDLQRNISQQESRIKYLQQQLEKCDTIHTTLPTDLGWSAVETTDSARVLSQANSGALPQRRDQ